MHKSKEAVLFLVNTFLLSTITGISPQVFASERKYYAEEKQYYPDYRNNEESY
jgi:hypothetical protein